MGCQRAEAHVSPVWDGERNVYCKLLDGDAAPEMAGDHEGEVIYEGAESDAASDAGDVAHEADKDDCPSPAEVARRGWRQVPLVVMLGLGAHFSKNALAPAEPVLEILGVSPMAYAGICATPTFATVIFPPLWAMAYVRHERLVKVAVPLGIFLGQIVINCGLELYQSNSSGALSQVMLLMGLLMISTCRAGGEVVQHMLLARLIPVGLTNGFVVIIFSTHLITMVCNFLVPKVIISGDHAMDGVLRVLWLLTLPSFMGVVSAGILCSFKMPPVAVSPTGSPKLRRARAHSWSSRAEVGFVPVPWYQRSLWRGRLLLTWGALIVGVLHGFQSITSGLLVSLGSTPTQAGTAIAKAQFVGLLAIPLVGVMDRFLGGGAVMVITSFLALGASCILSAATFVEVHAALRMVALLCISLAGTFAPVIALSLLPKNVRKMGTRYGVLDSLKSLAQMVAMMGLGILRTAEGFRGATMLTLVGLLMVFGLAVAIAPGIINHIPMQPDASGNPERRDESCHHSGTEAAPDEGPAVTQTLTEPLLRVDP